MTQVQESQIVRVVEQSGLAPGSAAALMDAFSPLFAAAQAVVDESKAITVTDATQVSAMKAARAARLKLRSVRLQVEEARKGLKEDSLRRGKAIDGVANVLKFLIEPEEARLEEAEKFAERAEAARIKAVADSRRALIGPFVVDPGAYAVSEMTDAAFDEFLSSLKLAAEARKAAEAKAAAEKAAAEQRDREERARVAEENRRLQAEAAEARRAAEAERAAADAKLRAEQAARAAEAKKAEDALRAERERAAAAEREATAARAAEAKREAEAIAAANAKREAEERAARVAAAAPDFDKINRYADAVAALAVEACSTDDGRDVASDVQAKAASFVTWIRTQAAKLK